MKKVASMLLAFVFVFSTSLILIDFGKVEAAAATVTSGKTYYIRNKNSGHFLDAEQSMNNNVIQHSFHGGKNQQWKVVSVGSGYYTLENQWLGYQNSGRKMLSVSTANNNCDLYFKTANLNTQMFKLVDNGDNSFRLLNKWGESSNQVIETQDASKVSPYNVQRYTWKNINCQKWYFIEVEAMSTEGGLATRTVTIRKNGDIAKNSSTWSPRINTAANAWNTSGAGTNITLTSSGSSPYVIEVGGYVWFDAGQCVNSPQGNTISTASIIYINLTGISIDMQFLKLSGDNLEKYERGLITHEMGHLFWLGDNPNTSNLNSSLMNSDRTKTTIFKPQAYDINNVRLRYD